MRAIVSVLGVLLLAAAGFVWFLMRIPDAPPLVASDAGQPAVVVDEGAKSSPVAAPTSGSAPAPADPVAAPAPQELVSGLVTDQAGAPLAGVRVTAAPRGSGRKRAWVKEHTEETETAADGSFSVAAPSPEVTVEARLVGWCGREVARADVGAGDTGLDLVLERCAGVAGTVRTESGKPVAEAAVKVRGVAAVTKGQSWRVYDREATTDEAGAYSLDSVPPGSVTLVATHPAWADGIQYVELALGEVLAPVDFELTAGLTISGHVFDQDAKPIEGAEVDADLGSGGAERGLAQRRSAVTDAEGSYVLLGLEAGRYRISPEHPDYFEPGLRHWDGGVEAGTEGYDMVLHRGGTVAGIVRDPDGKPVPLALVEGGTRYAGQATWGEESRPTPNAKQSSGRCEDDGTFELRGVAPGAIGICARDDDFLPSVMTQLEVEAAGWIDGVELRLQAGVAISGKVVDPEGAPTSGVRVGLTPPSGRGGRFVVTDRAGEFLAGGLVPGLEYGLKAHARGWIDPEPGRIVSAPAEGIVVPLARGATLRGTVHAPAGVQIAGKVGLRNPDDRWPRDKHSAAWDEAGAYEIEAILPGTWTVACHPEGGTYAEERSIALADGDVVEGFDFTLVQGGTVTGIVLDDDEQPFAGASVMATKPQSEWNGLPLGNVQTGPDGAFLFEGLPVESVRLQVHPPQGYRWLPPDLADGQGWRGVVTHVGEHVVLHVTRGQTIRGRVLDEEGQPVSLYTVFVRDKDEWSTGAMAIGHSEAIDGTFEVSGIMGAVARVDIDAAGFAALVVLTPGFPAKGDFDLGDLVLSRGGVVRGRVVGGTGAAVQGARVEAIPVACGENALRDQGGSIRPGVRESVSSGEQGEFELTGLGPGPTWLRAQATGTRETRIEVTVPERGALEGVVLTLTSGAAVFGQVRGAGDTPVARQHVSLSMDVEGEFRSWSATTDELGRYRVDGLPPGEASVYVHVGMVPIDERMSLSNGRSRKVTVPAGGEVRCDLEGFEACRLHGRVLGWAEGKVGSIRLQGGDLSLGGRIAEDGAYEIKDVPVGPCTLSIYGSMSEEFVVPPGESFRHDVQLPAGEVRGVVTRADGAGDAAGAKIELHPMEVQGPPGVHTATAGAGGTFRIPGVPQGSWELSASLAGVGSSGAVAVEVGESGTTPTPADLVLQSEVELPVQVLGIGGEPISGARVACILPQTSRGKDARTDASGIARVPGLAAGRVVLGVYEAGHGHLVAQHVVDPAAVGEPVVVQYAEPPATLELRFTRAGQPVPGGFRLTAAAGLPVADLTEEYVRSQLYARSGGLSILLAPGSYTVAPLGDPAPPPRAVNLPAAGLQLAIEIP